MSFSIVNYLILDNEIVHMVTHHPVHIYNKYGQQSPSAFIPFCQFGNNISTMGVKHPQFKFPVCKSFKEKYINNQLCYEVDVNQYKDKTFNSLNINSCSRQLWSVHLAVCPCASLVFLAQSESVQKQENSGARSRNLTARNTFSQGEDKTLI